MASINLNNLPNLPGCYLFKNKNGQVIYVGKAKNIRKRVKSYFPQAANLSPAKQVMVKEIDSLDTITTANETEALLLEINLIKKYRPKYNVVMKDDKNFAYLKIDEKQTFPIPQIVRQKENDGALYFGPYLSASSIKETLKFLNSIFPFATCRRNLDKISKRPCLKYHIGRCLGPCIRACTPAEYRQTITGIKKFLQGDWQKIASSLQEQMEKASNKQQFEKAALLRDRLFQLQKTAAKQQVVINQNVSFDVIYPLTDKKQTLITLLKIRQGKLIDKLNLRLSSIETDTAEILAQFLKQYLTAATDIPREIVLPQLPAISLAELKTISQKNIKITIPKSGRKQNLLEMARQNAFAYKQQILPAWQKHAKTLLNLQKLLKLPNPPKRIECYDIAHLHGKNTVGAMAVLLKGKLAKQHYRIFQIKYTTGINDMAALAEIITRRLNHQNWPLPDLIVLDGGKPQLSVVQKTLSHIPQAKPIKLIALAKKQELIYTPDSTKPIKLPQTSPELLLLRKLRDQTHKLANSYLQKTNQTRYKKSPLDNVPGLGKVSKIKLLQSFGSWQRIKQANLEEIAKIIGPHKAKILVSYMNKYDQD